MPRFATSPPPLDVHERAVWVLLPLAAVFGSALGAAGGGRPRGLTVVIVATIALSAISFRALLALRSLRQRRHERDGAPPWLMPLVTALPRSKSEPPSRQTDPQGRVACVVRARVAQPIMVEPGRSARVPTGQTWGGIGRGSPGLRPAPSDGSDPPRLVPLEIDGFGRHRELTVVVRNDGTEPVSIDTGLPVATLVFGPTPDSRLDVLAAYADPQLMNVGLLHLALALCAAVLLITGPLGTAVPVATALRHTLLLWGLGALAIGFAPFATGSGFPRIHAAILTSGMAIPLGQPLAVIATVATGGDGERIAPMQAATAAMLLDMALIAAVVLMTAPRWRPDSAPARS